MKKKYKWAIAVWLLIIATIYLASLSRAVGVVADAVILILSFVMMVGASIYKMFLWFRYRSDPGKRERVASSSQIYPERIRKLLMDEEADRETRR